MKTLLSLAGGALVLTEQAGVVTLSLDKSLSLGGGSAAGVLEVEGQGSVKLSGAQLLLLGEALLNPRVPAAILPEVQAGEALLNAEVSKL